MDKFDGNTALLEGEPAQHLGKVLRAQPGQVYELSDGSSVRVARVEEVGRDLIQFELMDIIPTREPQLEATLLLSIVKFDRFEWAIEKATELGVAGVVPLAAARSEKALVVAAAKRADRWRKILVESAQQARRLRPPVLHPLARAAEEFRSLATVAEENKRTGPRLILSERDSAPPLRKLLDAYPQGTTEAVVLAIGPEGGWTDEEFAVAGLGGFAEASLGANILRTETAVAAALACLNYVFA